MDLARSPIDSRLANVKPACKFGAWDVSEVDCKNVLLDQWISRHEEGGLGGGMKNS
jgi:hypothetical protein